jgi:antitoxin component HigA of HigAB toxin-antitoxin module
MHRIEVNVQTGEQQTIELTPEEIAELQNRPQPEPPPVLTTEQKLEAAGLTVAELRKLFGLPAPESELDV